MSTPSVPAKPSSPAGPSSFRGVSRAVRIRRGLTLPILLLILWEVSSRTGLADPRFLPPVEAVFEAGRRELIEHGMIWDLASSLWRNIVGFLIGSALGIVFGSWLALSRAADVLVMPVFSGVKQISLLAWIPLISVWFGFDEEAKIVFVALAAFIPVALNTHEGMRAAPADILEVGRALTFGPFQRLFLIRLPAALPSIATGVHLGLIYAWLATVGAEYFLAVGPGIGGLVIAGRERFDMAMVIIGILILGLVGFTFNRLATSLEAYLLRWRPSSN